MSVVLVRFQGNPPSWGKFCTAQNSTCLFDFNKLGHIYHGHTHKTLKKRHLEKVSDRTSDDPLDAFRSVVLRSGKSIDQSKDIEEAVAEAGHETRSVDQVVKLVNIHLSEKVKRLNELKAASKRFDEELNMFTNPFSQEANSSASEPTATPTSPAPNHAPSESSNESQAVFNDLLILINKYGFEKLSQALDEILSKNTANR